MCTRSPAPAPAAPALLTTSDVARLLAVSVDRVRQLARTGQLPSSSTPYGRLFDAATVQAAHDRYRADRRRAPAEPSILEEGA